MNKQELFEQMEELLDEYLLAAETEEIIPVEIEEEEPVEDEMQEESDDEILKIVRN